MKKKKNFYQNQPFAKEVQGSGNFSNGENRLCGRNGIFWVNCLLLKSFSKGPKLPYYHYILPYPNPRVKPARSSVVSYRN